MQVTAPNGVVWTRGPGGTTTGDELLRALTELRTLRDVVTVWDWWQEGRQDREHDRVMNVLMEWDNTTTPCSEEQAEASAEIWMAQYDERREQERRLRAERVAAEYDQDREKSRLQLLRKESDAAFFRHVLEAAANPAQKETAARLLEVAVTEAGALRETVGDPEEVLDVSGFLPAERREHHLRSHLDHWRHPTLREWSTSDKRRFKALLAMPALTKAEMCSECEAPAAWHDYDISLRLFHPAPPSGSQAEALARLMPGWWERCPACTSYKIAHVWGGKNALPDFDGEQYLAMLPPLLRTVFGPAPTKPPRKTPPKPKPLETIPSGLPIDEVTQRLAQAQTRHPGAEVRTGTTGGWELWPTKS